MTTIVTEGLRKLAIALAWMWYWHDESGMFAIFYVYPVDLGTRNLDGKRIRVSVTIEKDATGELMEVG